MKGKDSISTGIWSVYCFNRTRQYSRGPEFCSIGRVIGEVIGFEKVIHSRTKLRIWLDVDSKIGKTDLPYSAVLEIDQEIN